jgi:fermentation-respiration switch protein FrsA (DUF1100 family)
MQKRTQLLIGLAATLIVLSVGVYFGLGYVIYDKLANIEGSCDEHQANRPDNFALHERWPADFDVTPYFMSPYEPVKFPSRDAGIEVAGWWIPKDPTAPVVILVDGLGGCKNSIAVLTPAGMLWRNGFNVLMIDLRDTGDSTYEDGRSAIGNEEYRDVLGAWDWLVQTKGFAPQRIGLFANSLGGATANYAFSAEPRLAALFLQSTFGNLQQVLAGELQRAGYPAFLAPGAILMGRVVSGDNLVAQNPLDAIRKAGGRPVYIVHTRADTRIAIAQSEQLAAAARAAGVKVTTWFPERGEHVQTPAVYPQEFEQRMMEFFRQSLSQ